MKLIKFSAGWCQPCKRLQAVLDAMDVPYQCDGVDIDKDPAKAAQYGIRGVPTVVLVDAEGVEQKRFVGTKSQSQIQEWLDE